MWPWLIFAFVVYLWYDGKGDVIEGAFDVWSTIMRGARLTTSTFDKSTGMIQESPTALADAAGLDLETYTLARLLSSEEGTAGNLERIAVGAAALNYANQQGTTLFSLLTGATRTKNAGTFGSQPGRFASTRQDPYQGDGELATGLREGTILDVTNGATHWDVPGGEDAAQVAANRLASGLIAYPVEGIDPDDLRFWGPGVRL